jgi:2-iminobutanoate/2-iminopropanoate deaminase
MVIPPGWNRGRVWLLTAAGPRNPLVTAIGVAIQDRTKPHSTGKELSMKKTIMAEKGPTPAGPYSHAVVANGFVFISGQGPMNPETGRMPDAFQDQVRQTLENVKTVLEAAGSSLEDVVKVNAYVTDLTRFAEFNEVYKEFFRDVPPARTTVATALLGILVEVDCVAVVGESEQ